MRTRPSSPAKNFGIALGAAVGLVFAAWPGEAQTPRLPPEFHARVFLAGFANQLEVRQAGLRRRVDVASGGIVQSFISDRTRGALVVMTAAGRQRVAFLFPLAAAEVNAPIPLDVSAMAGSRLTRMGASRVAGRPCTLQRYTGYLGRSGVICASAEGLILQMTPDGRRSPIFQVMSITFTKQDNSWFTPPADYQLSALPGTGGIAVRPQASTSR
jgi:hypothetical protein